MSEVESLVNVDWLYRNLDSPEIVVLDGTWVMPGSEDILPTGFIPGARFFDIDEIATPHPTLTHMLPNAERFRAAMENIGVKNDHHVICYDRRGVSTAPRLWWTFRMFGHAKVSVLDGGLPAWIDAGHPVNATTASPTQNSSYTPEKPLSGVITKAEILELLGANADPQILDARPIGRYLGIDPEPRPGLRQGHIPGSLSFAFKDCVDDKKFKDLTELKTIVDDLNLDFSKPIITSCGSGVAACGIAFVLARLGTDNVQVYDGSWSEWGASDAPIEI